MTVKREGCWYCFRTLDPSEAVSDRFVQGRIDNPEDRVVLLHGSCLNEATEQHGANITEITSVTIPQPPPLVIEEKPHSIRWQRGTSQSCTPAARQIINLQIGTLLSVLLIVIAAAAVTSYQAWFNRTIETYYQGAIVAMEQQSWDAARTELDAVIRMKADYKDTQILLRESYYRPVVQALKHEDWSTAQTNGIKLINLDPAYKDAPILLRESYYRPAQQALEEQEWEQTRLLLDQLSQIDLDYKDAADLRYESYYQPAVKFIQRQEWTEARTLLQTLLTMNQGYKDCVDLLLESYYQPAVSLFNQHKYKSAYDKLTELNRIAIQYGRKEYRNSVNMITEIDYLLAKAAYDDQDWEQSIQRFEALLKTVPSYKDASSLLTESYYQGGLAAYHASNWSAALQSFEKLLKRSNNYKDTNSIIGKINLALNPESATPQPVSQGKPQGIIVFQCNIDGFQQICIMNGDGSNQQQFTFLNSAAATYPSLSPDGKSVFYTSNETGDHAIYERGLNSESARQITEQGGDKAYPELSPDGRTITYTDVNHEGKNTIYYINRDGSGFREVFEGGTRASWSPDGKRIAFICIDNNKPQICIMNADGSNLYQVTHLDDINFRAAWSPDGNQLTFSIGNDAEKKRKICVINTDGSGFKVLYDDGDAVTPAFSPDGRWIVFTNYRINSEKVKGEIFIMRIDGSDVQQLTNNSRSDWLPYWGIGWID